MVFLTKDFGQDLFNPPNIAGWPTGKQWLAGQFLEKRMSRLQNHFSKPTISINSNSQINKEAKGLLSKVSSKYKDELDLFYKNLVDNQLGVETIVINWIPKDFETREWADIDVGFYGVKLNGKFWKGINLKFGTDINSKMKTKWKNLNRIEVRHGFSYPPLFTSWENSWISNRDGHYGWNSSFPKGPRMSNFNAKTKDERLLMIRLLQAMEHVLENKNSSRYLMYNAYVQNWLKDRINEANQKWSLENTSIQNTKIFSFVSNDNDKDYRTFQCGGKRAEINFAEARSLNKALFKDLSSGYLQEPGIKLTTLLLPEVDLRLDEEDFISILSYEGYQLK